MLHFTPGDYSNYRSALARRLTDKQTRTIRELVHQIAGNPAQVAGRGRQPELELYRAGEAITLQRWAEVVS